MLFYLNVTFLQNAGLLKDERFSSLFANPDFAIDKESREFKMLHHNVTRMEEKAQKKKGKLVDKFLEVDEKNTQVASKTSVVCTCLLSPSFSC